MSENRKITKAATVIGAGTLASRILGFLRDMVIANFFGTGMAADAFFVAFRIPNLWRRLVGEGSLTISFIPVYTEYLTNKSEEESREVTHIAFTIAGAGLLALTILGVIFSPILIRFFAWGWAQNSPEKFQLTVTLSRILFPYLFFIGLVALSMGILNSRRHFFAPAFSPIFLNISIILSVLLLYPFFRMPVMTLVLGVLAGGILQFLFQIPFLINKGVSFRFNSNFRHPAIKRIGSLMIHGVMGTAVYQLNVLVDTFFCSFLPEGSVSSIYYADRFMEFPLGIFGMAIAMASLPSLSKIASQERMDEFKDTLSYTFRLTSFISVPSMIGLIALKTPIINLFLQRGVFDSAATAMTVRALFFYSVGLWAIAGARTIAPAFYSLQDTRTPFRIAVVCLAVNALLNTAFIYLTPLGNGGPALATSLSSMLNLFLLSRKLGPKVGGLDVKKNVYSLIRIFLCSIPMGLVSFFIASFQDWSTTGHSVQKVLILAASVIGGLVCYLASSYLAGNEEMLFLLKMVKRRKRSLSEHP